jgi:hypothetical protein
MTLFFISLLVMGLVIAGMSVGVIAGRSPIKGSCGGMGSVGIDTACDLCGGDPQRCDEESGLPEGRNTKSSQFYSADK